MRWRDTDLSKLTEMLVGLTIVLGIFAWIAIAVILADIIITTLTK